MERKFERPRAWGDDYGEPNEAERLEAETEANALDDWDPWWPITARPDALRMLGVEPSRSRPYLELVRRESEPPYPGPTVESAVAKLEGVLSAATVLSPTARAEHAMVALFGLASALRKPRYVLEKLLCEVGSTIALSALSQMQRLYERLAQRTDDLAAEAEDRDFAEVRFAIRRLVGDVEGALAAEVDTVVDVYWLDAGVVD